ncbi:DUF3426 domain-containing protein [Pseudomonas sp. sp1636]|uniref:DUF3426 domain-containing protein n=1 Tax=Pseudomonas sp. sp1636 TaxID=3036707 RepID=UPI0025A592C7|nr:DUF3426 domain-containing protein [Pseudomonas sp. sp1636]MDM8348502.1 DUF3426 domain-containing protein [Pseudomonas sp. sp1636]
MPESFVTQCPHCRTSFRVNLVQLGAARGAVRCGACLHVFNAAQQLLEHGQRLPDSTRLPPPAAAPMPQAKPAPTPPQNHDGDGTLWIHDDLDLDSLDLDEELAKLEAQEHQLSQQFRDLSQASRHTETFRTAKDAGTPGHNEDWAEALLREDAAPSNSTPLTPGDAPQPLSRQDATPTAAPPSTAQAEHDPAHNEPSFKPSALDKDNLEPERDEAGLSAQRHDPRLDQDIEAEPLDTPDARTPRQPDGKPARSEPGLRDEHLFELDDEPLQLDWQPPRQPWGRRLGWAALNLLAATALIGQHIHYNFDELARQDQYRPWFEQLCPALGCTLPSKVDIGQIKSSNLVVRSHPEFSGALVVDAILYNRAPFSQPFPLLEMRFADINGRLLASRRFKPSEYLAGELAGQAEMPPQTPIHVSLDILDPGTQAVNYSLSFHSPE